MNVETTNHNSTELQNESTKEDYPLHTDSSTTSPSKEHLISLISAKQDSSPDKASNSSEILASIDANIDANSSQVPEIHTSSPGESSPQSHNNFPSQDINMLTPNSNRALSGSPTLSPANYSSDSSNLTSPSTPLSAQKGSSPTGLFNSFSVNPQGKPTTSGQPQSPSPAKSKPYVCSECNQTFSRQHNLKSHALTHSQEKPFQCDVCQHFFRRHHDLKRHAKLHTGEKPYQCPHCKRSFARLDALNRHLRAESFCGGPQKKLYQTSTNGQQQIEQMIERPQQIQSQPQPLPPPQQKQNKQQIDKNVVLNVDSDQRQVNKSPKIQQRQSQENIQQIKQWQQKIPMQKAPSNNQQSIHNPINNSNRISHGQIVFPVESVTKPSPARYVQYSQESPQRIVDDQIKLDSDMDVMMNRRTTLEIQLKERNDYLEDRVRQLENEVINERKLRNRRELLEEQVRKLEIEKNLLKSLLLERSNRGPADLGPTGGPGGGYDAPSMELTKRPEKKRKASYLSELSSPSKHQKDYDGTAVIPQSAQ
ncbi:hypothetical protein C1645_764475 [Glomus cerebriforme]|uniref:C2H2-type domain-containing protein n=1 Tax=Glomus cerebriforme TaxID=658196 RepID=A0A397T5K6_9GLOM|nr:hypothetical protein C1645_764475 [Glomus cerebriforme]